MSDSPRAEAAIRRTPLHATHLRLGGRVAPFGGWEMPIHYAAGILAEHRAVRTAAGVFDISHMGELLVRGPGGRAWLNTVFSNDLGKITAGRSLYGFLLNEAGGVIDDLIVYEMYPDIFALVVNAAKIEEDFSWLQTHLPPAGTAGFQLENVSDQTAALAVQGPRAEEVLAAFFGPDVPLPARHGDLTHGAHDGQHFMVSRTGYTGEDGFELFFPATVAETTLDRLLAAGAPFGLLPCGLGARDSLRLEVCYPLNGSDLSPTRTPLEAGLGFFVDLGKVPAFIGQAALQQQKADGVRERLTAFRMTEKSPPPRSHYVVAKDGQPVGETTSGGLAPSLDGVGIGLAYLPAALAKPGETVQIDIRGRRFGAVVEKKPFYKRAPTATNPAAHAPVA